MAWLHTCIQNGRVTVVPCCPGPGSSCRPRGAIFSGTAGRISSRENLCSWLAYFILSQIAGCRYQKPTQVYFFNYTYIILRVYVLTCNNEDPVRIAVIGGTGISHLEHEGFTVSYSLFLENFISLPIPFILWLSKQCNDWLFLLGCCVSRYRHSVWKAVLSDYDLTNICWSPHCFPLQTRSPPWTYTYRSSQPCQHCSPTLYRCQVCDRIFCRR